MADLRNDIEKYLKGELTPGERNALERRALDDPFLMEALEGAEQLASSDFSLDIQKLHHALHERIRKPKTISLRLWPARIAAGLALLALSTFVVLKLVQHGPSNELALQEKPMSEKSTGGLPEGTPSMTDSLTVNTEKEISSTPIHPPEKFSDNASEKSPLSSKRFEPQEKPKVASATDIVLEQEGLVKEQQPVITTEEVVVQASPSLQVPSEQLQRYVQESGARERAEAEDASKKLNGKVAGVNVQELNKSNTNDRVLRGRVTDTEGDGLPGVNVIIKGSNIGTVTNATGDYEIPVDEKASELVFSFIGMQTLEEEITDGSELNVTLDQDVSQLSEVVVVGYGSIQKTSEEEKVPTFEFAVPAGGRTAYRQYLEKNLRYPEQALENNIEGRVTIQFTIDANGKIGEFNVLKSLGYGCDEEVVRLIKKGPKWNPTKRDAQPVKDKVKVRMRFRLPKK